MVCKVENCTTEPGTYKNGERFTYCFKHGMIKKQEAISRKESEPQEMNSNANNGTCFKEDCDNDTDPQKSNPSRHYKYCTDCTTVFKKKKILSESLYHLLKARNEIENFGEIDDEVVSDMNRLEDNIQEIKNIIGLKRKRE